MDDCLFCQVYAEKTRVIYESEHWFVIEDAYPVTEHHMLIIPKRHLFGDLLLLPLAIREDFWSVGLWVRTKLAELHGMGGYNLVVNCGKTAGQTVYHLHVHVIPAYVDDPAPRGGARNFRKSLTQYP